MQMKSKYKRTIGILIPLTILILLSLYSFQVGPQKNPPMKEILNNPTKYEGENIEMRGTIKKHKIEGENLILTLERYGRTFKTVYEFSQNENFEKIKKGDILSLKGVSKLSMKGHVEATKILYRSQERNDNLLKLSVLGLLIILGIMVWDRETVREVVPFG